MLKRLAILSLFIVIVVPSVRGETAEQEYVNQLNYRRSKLEIVVKRRVVDVSRSYSTTDIRSTTYTLEAYSQTYGTISTQSGSQKEAQEITDWYIYKGGIRELSDLEFLELAGDRGEYERIKGLDGQRATLRLVGNSAIGLGLIAMIGGAALSASQSVISGGALTTTAGFFLSAFSQTPHHYFMPDYAQGKIDEYNIALKKKLNLPLQFE